MLCIFHTLEDFQSFLIVDKRSKIVRLYYNVQINANSEVVCLCGSFLALGVSIDFGRRTH